MKIKHIIILIIILVIIYFSYNFGMNKKDSSENQKKYIQKQEGTYKWLISQFYQMTKIAKRNNLKADNKLSANLLLEFNQSITDSKYDWALSILNKAFEKNVSYSEMVKRSLKYLRVKKWGYDILENFDNYEGDLS